MPEKESKPQVADAVTQQGSTFAERAAASAGKSAPKRKVDEAWENSSFASRSGKGKKADAKQVGEAENKSVSSSESKKKS